MEHQREYVINVKIIILLQPRCVKWHYRNVKLYIASSSNMLANYHCTLYAITSSNFHFLMTFLTMLMPPMRDGISSLINTFFVTVQTGRDFLEFLSNDCSIVKAWWICKWESFFCHYEKQRFIINYHYSYFMTIECFTLAVFDSLLYCIV